MMIPETVMYNEDIVETPIILTKNYERQKLKHRFLKSNIYPITKGLKMIFLRLLCFR